MVRPAFISLSEVQLKPSTNLQLSHQCRIPLHLILMASENSTPLGCQVLLLVSIKG